MGTWLHNLHLQWFHPAPRLRCPHQSPWECPWTSPLWWTRRPHRRRSWHTRITANHRGGHDCPVSTWRPPSAPRWWAHCPGCPGSRRDTPPAWPARAPGPLPASLRRQTMKPLYFGKQNIPTWFRLCPKKPFLVGISLRGCYDGMDGSHWGDM